MVTKTAPLPLVTGQNIADALGSPVATPSMNEAATVADQLIRPYLAPAAWPNGDSSPAVLPVHEAALVLAIDVMQNRTAAGGQNVGIDGQPGPYRMGRSLLDRVSGLLGPWLNQASELA
jgi:hypothetical protein